MSESRNFLSGDLFFEDGFVFCSLVGIVCLAAFIGIIATGYLKKDGENLLCCLGGGAAGVISLIATLITCGSVESEAASAAKQFGASLNVSVSCGIGFWIGVIALVACAAMAFLLPDDAE